MSLLTDLQKKNIVADFLSGAVTKAQLARNYNVSPRTIGRIIDTATQDCEVEDDFEEEIAQTTYNFVCSPTVITITKTVRTESTGSSESETITSESENFSKVFSIVTENKFSDESLEQALQIMSKKKFIESLTFGNIKVDVEAGTIVYTYPGSDEVVNLSPRLANRIISSFRREGEDSDTFLGLIEFTERLAWNPDEIAVQRLYDFIEATDIEITNNGMVKCYKKVRDDFKDIYTGKFDNSPGTTVKVQRKYVDPNPDQTCSQGLHVCSWSYLQHYGDSTGAKILECLVDPKDFVAIPRDYNNAKARVCEYYVIGEAKYSMPSQKYSTSLLDDDSEYWDDE